MLEFQRVKISFLCTQASSSSVEGKAFPRTKTVSRNSDPNLSRLGKGRSDRESVAQGFQSSHFPRRWRHLCSRRHGPSGLFIEWKHREKGHGVSKTSPDPPTHLVSLDNVL